MAARLRLPHAEGILKTSGELDLIQSDGSLPSIDPFEFVFQFNQSSFPLSFIIIVVVVLVVRCVCDIVNATT
jgi:hypothetical protein